MIGSHIGPNSQKLASWLLEYEAFAEELSSSPASITRVSEKLRLHLISLAGSSGFHALQARALVLSKIQTSRLKAIEVGTNGSLEGLESLANGETFSAGTVLIGTLLELLNVFIGYDLVFHLLQNIWSELPERESDSWELKED